MKNVQLNHFIIGTIIGALVALIALNFLEANVSEEDKLEQEIAAYYANSVATLVSPHSLREKMSHGEETFLLVDTRAVADYEREHIVGAINIDSNQSEEDFVAAFKALPTDREIIIYCYSSACMNGRKAGNLLAENDVFVKEMTIGWNEWRYGWEMWNYETEWDTHKVEDYVVSGSEPGEVTESAKSFAPCPIDGSLGC